MAVSESKLHELNYWADKLITILSRSHSYDDEERGKIKSFYHNINTLDLPYAHVRNALDKRAQVEKSSISQRKTHAHQEQIGLRESYNTALEILDQFDKGNHYTDEEYCKQISRLTQDFENKNKIFSNYKKRMDDLSKRASMVQKFLSSSQYRFNSFIDILTIRDEEAFSQSYKTDTQESLHVFADQQADIQKKMILMFKHSWGLSREFNHARNNENKDRKKSPQLKKLTPVEELKLLVKMFERQGAERYIDKHIADLPLPYLGQV